MRGAFVALAILGGTLTVGTPARTAADQAPAATAPRSGGEVAPDPVRVLRGQELLDQAWRGAGDSLAERAKRTRAAALELGIWSLDPAARAILLDPSLGSALERAEAAALLAPELPDALLALARERLAAGSPRAALDAVRAALTALDRHPDASSWMRVAFFDALARTAVLGSLWFVAVAGLGTLSALALPLGVRIGAPAPSAAALLGALLLLPAALGEGVLGIACACAALGLARGGIAQRAAVVGALALLLAGLFPLAALRNRALALAAGDPIGDAVSGAERDFASALDLLRLERAAPRDALARRALALQKRREGDVLEADLRFRALLDQGGISPALLNNAANTRFGAGYADEALELYERAVREQPSPLALFNLAQSYGRAIQLEEQDLVLAQAQALDPRAIHALTQHVAEVGAGGPVDVPVSVAELNERARFPVPPRSGFSLRLAPGWLGSSWPAGAVGVAFAILGGAALAFPLRRLGTGGDFSAVVARLIQRSEGTDPSARMARLSALRVREVRMARLGRLAAWIVPSAAGTQSGSGFLGLSAALLATAVFVALGARGGVVPDPLAAAATGAFVFEAAAFGAAIAYAGVLAVSLLQLGRRRDT